MANPKKISRDDYLRAFALFTMAAQHNTKANEFSDGLAKILGLERTNDLYHLADAIWGDAGPFDEALRKEGFEVEE